VSGINVIQTAKDVGAFFNSWVTYVNSAKQYSANPNDSSAQQGMLASANALSSAIATLGKDPLYASALGTLAGVTDIPAQVYAYQTALAAGKINDQTAALSSIAVDSAGIANTAATTIAGWATAIGNSGLADLMGEIGENANDFALAVGAVGTAVDVGNWFNSTFLPGLNKWIGNTPPQLDEDMLLNLNDPSGDSEIIMPGASGDTLAEKPLSGGAFQYTENNAQGTQTSSVQLAYNGSVDELMVTGAGVVADVSAFQINVSTGATDTISGNNDTINAGASSTTALYGTGGIVNFIPNSGAIFRLYNADSSATVNGTGNTVGIWATGDSVTASGETFNFAPGGFSINIAGGSDTVNENSGMSVSASGGGNTINAAAGTMTSVSGTNGNADQINANGLQFGGTSANGLGTGIWLGANTQVNLAGSGDGLNENAGDSVTAYGGDRDAGVDSDIFREAEAALNRTIERAGPDQQWTLAGDDRGSARSDSRDTRPATGVYAFALLRRSVGPSGKFPA